MQHVAITSKRYRTHYRTFSLSLAWFGGYLQRLATRYRQVYKKVNINIFFKKIDGNAW